MAPQVKQAGNSATGFSNNFMSMLSGLLGGTGGMSGTSQFSQANPTGQTMGGASGILQSILGQGAGKLGGALGTEIQQQQQRDVNSINSRFGAFGGTSLGTPGASAVAQYRAQAAPQIATQIGQLQLGAMQPLLAAGSNLANRGVTTPYFQSNPLTQGIQGLTGLASGVAGLAGPLGMMGGGGGNMSPSSLLSQGGVPNGGFNLSPQQLGMDPATYYAMMGGGGGSTH